MESAEQLYNMVTTSSLADNQRDTEHNLSLNSHFLGNV